MKRIFAVIIVLALMVICNSCASAEKTKVKPNLNTCFSGEVSISYGDDINASAVIKRLGKGVWEIEFSEPQSLAGVKLAFADGEAEASYKGLSFSIPQSVLPVKSMLINLMNAVDSAAEAEELEGTVDDDAFTVEGQIDSGGYKVAVNPETGQLISFEMPNFELSMEFKNMVCEPAVGDTGTTTTSAESETVSETVATTIEST